jgi:hypothetical protein
MMGFEGSRSMRDRHSAVGRTIQAILKVGVGATAGTVIGWGFWILQDVLEGFHIMDRWYYFRLIGFLSGLVGFAVGCVWAVANAPRRPSGIIESN